MGLGALFLRAGGGEGLGECFFFLLGGSTGSSLEDLAFLALVFLTGFGGGDSSSLEEESLSGEGEGLDSSRLRWGGGDGLGDLFFFLLTGGGEADSLGDLLLRGGGGDGLGLRLLCTIIGDLLRLGEGERLPFLGEGDDLLRLQKM